MRYRGNPMIAKLRELSGFSRWEQLHTVRYCGGRCMYWYLYPDDHSLRPATLWEWCHQLKDYESRKVGLTVLGNGKAYVSTVFLGLDHNFEGPPAIFETKVDCPLWEEYDGSLFRYSTWDEAKAGHDHHVAELLGRLGGFLTDQTNGA